MKINIKSNKNLQLYWLVASTCITYISQSVHKSINDSVVLIITTLFSSLICKIWDIFKSKKKNDIIIEKFLIIKYVY